MTICMRSARRATGLSRTRFADALGVQRSTGKGWEQGTRIPTEQRVQSVEQLLTRMGVDLRVMEAGNG